MMNIFFIVYICLCHDIMMARNFIMIYLISGERLLCKPLKCSTVSINDTSSEMRDLSQLIEVVFVMGDIAFSV